MKNECFSYASLANASFLEDLYQKYQQDPNSVDSTWRYFFSGMEFSLKTSPLPTENLASGDLGVFKLIQAYRIHGHKKAKISPLQEDAPQVKELDLRSFGFQKEDLERSFVTFGLFEENVASLSRIIARLEEIYCQSIGFEFTGVSPELESWILSQIEDSSLRSKQKLSFQDKQKIMRDLNAAELFEMFIHTKYPGQTRFSLEGGETLIPMLTFFLDEAAHLQAGDVTIGMAHRGRLNVLVNVLEKSYEQVFHEFEDTSKDLVEGSGDVKYHKGVHSNVKTKSGFSITVSVAPNPSHLESVDPVVEGLARAKQDLKKDANRTSVIPLLIHGDASLSGQGVVYEILQMNRLSGYSTGGTVHIVVNNHIGYTTFPRDSRSTLYCTDIAKTFGAPVFHVNAEFPEDCIFVTLLACKIRQLFHVDVFIDLNCYRKYGHNEGDEPTFTQPIEYKKIRKKKSIRELYKAKLTQEGIFQETEIVQEETLLKEKMQDALTCVLSHPKLKEVKIDSLTPNPIKAEVPSVSNDILVFLSEKITHIPQSFHIHSKLQRLVGERLKMLQQKSENKGNIDWGMAENLAYASLLKEKIHVRLSGQDVARGTFSHRHASWIDQETSEEYVPLNHIEKDQALFSLYNSFLSEFAVMGFDLGYSLSYPNSLVLWEAQFGDFANGAQVIIDQYLATSEQKWAYRSNLTLLLPHGYEGKGPEHSSARLERFLQLCAQDNLIIANCTTPAQFFHLLRRQAYLLEKRPLVVFTPKVLLRHPSCVSSLVELSEGHFQEVVQDPTPSPNPKKILFCSGKVFYDLLEERAKREDSSCVILRLEQLYPFPSQEILTAIASFLPTAYIAWVQEEPKNMGAWTYLQPLLEELLKAPVHYVGRESGASPATGSYALHKKQYESFMAEAFQSI